MSYLRYDICHTHDMTDVTTAAPELWYNKSTVYKVNWEGEMEKGQIFIDTRDEQELIVTMISEVSGRDTLVEFLEINPLGKFVAFEEWEMNEVGIKPAF